MLVGGESAHQTQERRGGGKGEHHTLPTLHHRVLAGGALWDDNTKNTKQTFGQAAARKRRPWFESLRANAGEPVTMLQTVRNL